LEVVKLVGMIRHAAEKAGVKSWYSPEKLRVISCYQGQVGKLRQMLHQHGFGMVLVASVDSSQGCEADIVVVSFVRSNKSQGKTNRSAGFLQDERRLNVSLTRAKFQLICIGNALGTLAKAGVESLKELVDDATRRKCIRSCL